MLEALDMVLLISFSLYSQAFNLTFTLSGWIYQTYDINLEVVPVLFQS